MSATKDLTGQIFGRLKVDGLGVKPDRQLSAASLSDNWWLCTCQCGKTTTVRTTSLRSGNTKSCGCLNRDVNRLMAFERKMRNAKIVV